MVEKLSVSERRACVVIGQCRSSQRYQERRLPDENQLQRRIIELAREYGRYGYRRITAMLWQEGWVVNHKRVERIWREEGLKVPAKQPKKSRLWLNDGSCIRLRPEYTNHVWSYDFVEDRTQDGKKFRIFCVIDEFSRECLATVPRRRWTWQHVREVLALLFIERGPPRHVRSDNGPEFIAKKLRTWFLNLQVGPLFIEPGSPWENGYCESFNSKLRDEFLNGEIFYTLFEVEVLTNRWRHHYNTVRPHSSLGYRPPAPETLAVVGLT